MQHCNTNIFASDNYCGECGEHLLEKPNFCDVTDIAPETMAEICEHYPSAWTYTGKVVSTFLYKRNSMAPNSNVTYSYWWIEIANKDGEIDGVSVNAENPFWRGITKGDIVTILYPSDFTLTFSIVGKQAQQTITNDAFASAAIKHEDDGQAATVEEQLTPSMDKMTLWWGPVLFSIWGGLGFASYGHVDIRITLLGTFGVALSIVGIWFGLSYRARSKRYQKDIKRYDILGDNLKQLQKVTKKQLGYHHSDRPQHDSDVICFDCKTRIDATHTYCAGCGVSQKNIPKSVTSHRSVGEEEETLMQEFYLNYSEQYEHKHLLSSDERAEIKCYCFLGKVVEKNINVTPVDITCTETTTTSNRTYLNGHLTQAQDNDVKSTSRSRQSHVSGQVSFKTSGNRVFVESLPETMLSDLEKGDWFFFAKTLAVDLRHPNINLESAYNVTKKRSYAQDTFSDYGLLDGKEIGFIVLFIAVIINYLYPLKLHTHLNKLVPYPNLQQLLADPFISNNLPMILFAGLTSIVLVWRGVYGIRNYLANRKVMFKLRSKINDISAQSERIEEEINRIA
jgi:hypothetical protein